jgi:hypothetical protein
MFELDICWYKSYEWGFLCFRCLLVHTTQLNPQLSTACSVQCLQDNFSAWTPWNKLSSVVKNVCLLACYLAMHKCHQHRKHLLQRSFYCCMRVFQVFPKKWVYTSQYPLSTDSCNSNPRQVEHLLRKGSVCFYTQKHH